MIFNSNISYSWNCL